MLFYVNYRSYLHSVENSSRSTAWIFIEPPLTRVIANTIGVAGNMIALEGFIEFYKRNILLPVFGR